MAQPLTPASRIATLDILRGLALLGMVLAHFHKLVGTADANFSTNPIGWFITLFVAEKDRAIFALLFGAGFAIMLRQLEKKSLPVGPIFLRRLLVLYAIGIAVETLTQFKILREYAWWGVALLLVRNLPAKTLLLLAGLSAAAFSVRDIVDETYALATQGREAVVANDRIRQQSWEAARQAEQAVLQGSHYGEVVRARLSQMANNLVSLRTLTPNAYLALFILGLLLVRHRIVENPLPHRRWLLGIVFAGITLWAVAWWLLPLIPGDLLTPRLDHRMHRGFGLIDEQFLALAYAAGAILLFAARPGLQALCSPFAWVGRMALTNYIVHAAIIDLLASHYALGLRVSPPQQLLLAALLFGGLWAFSRWWLGRFRYGPVEWMWRSLTYWKAQPLRLPPATGQ